MRAKETLMNFLELLEEMQKGKEEGKHSRCVFANTLLNVRDVAEANNIDLESFMVRDQWKSTFKK